MLEITAANVHLAMPNESENVLAYCEITFCNSFVVHNIRLLKKKDPETQEYYYQVMMPARFKVGVTCTHCKCKTEQRWFFCAICGKALTNQRLLDPNEKPMRDMAHPINRETRLMIENAIINAYEKRLQE